MVRAGGSGWCRSRCRCWRPKIFVVVLTTLIHALQGVRAILVLTQGGPDDATLAPSYLTYFHFFTTQRVGYAAAVATVQMILTLGLAVIFLWFQTRQSGAGSVAMVDAVLAGTAVPKPRPHASPAGMRSHALVRAGAAAGAARVHAVPVLPRVAQCVQAGRRLCAGRAAVVCRAICSSTR